MTEFFDIINYILPMSNYLNSLLKTLPKEVIQFCVAMRQKILQCPADEEESLGYKNSRLNKPMP